MNTHNLRFNKGATHLVVGPSSSGKTFRTIDILKSKNEIIEDGAKIKNIVLCYAVWQDIYQELKDNNIVTKFVNKNPTNAEYTELVREHKHTGGSIVILDDFMSEINKDMMEIVTVTSRHYNVSTFILFQSLFPANKLARQISLNVRYIHVGKNPRENAQFLTLARQIYPNNYKFIVEAYCEVTKTPHSFFLLDLTQSCPENLRFRSHYLKHEFPMRVWIKK